MDRAVIKNQALRVLYKAADSFTSRDPIKVPGIKGEPSSANLHPRAAGDTCDETKMAASTCCAPPRRAPRQNAGRKVKQAVGPWPPTGELAQAPGAPGATHTVEIPPEVVSGAAHGATLGSMALPGLAGAGLGAGYGLLNPGRDEKGNRKSRLMAALKYGLIGGAGGAAAGPLGAMGAVGGGVLGTMHGLNKLDAAQGVAGAAMPQPGPSPRPPMERRASAPRSLAVKLAMMTTTPTKQVLPIGQGATQRQKDQAQATLKQNGRII